MNHFYNIRSLSFFYYLPFYLLIFLINENTFSQYSWEQLPLPDSVNARTVSFNDNNTIFITTNHGIYFSYNGIQWEWLNFDGYGVVFISKEDKIYFGSSNLYCSDDNGLSWDTIYKYTPGEGGIVSIFTPDDINIYFGTWGGIYSSFDGGISWIETLDLFSTESITAIDNDSEGALYASSISFSGDLSPGGVYKSSDNGISWDLIGLNYHFATSLKINSNNNIFVGTDGHYYNGTGIIYRSCNSGQTWENVYNNLYTLSISVKDINIVAAGSKSGIFCSYNNGVTWLDITPSDTMRYYENVSFHPLGQLYAISYFVQGDLFRTTQPVQLKSHGTNYDTIIVYPIPTSNILSVRSSAIINSIILKNVNGNVINNYKNVKSVLFEINIEFLETGMYIICIETEKNISYMKAVIH